MTGGRPRAAAAALAALAVAAGALAVLGGRPPAEAALAAACAPAVLAGLALAGRGAGVAWPSRPAPERTSAGWHEVRLLAESLAAGGRDPAARAAAAGRVRAALAAADGGSGAGAGTPRAVTRREYDEALARLRQRARPGTGDVARDPAGTATGGT